MVADLYFLSRCRQTIIESLGVNYCDHDLEQLELPRSLQELIRQQDLKDRIQNQYNDDDGGDDANVASFDGLGHDSKLGNFLPEGAPLTGGIKRSYPVCDF